MTNTVSIDPDAPQKAVEQKALLLEILPKASVVLITLLFSGGREFKLPLVLSGDALEQIRPVLIAEALRSHAECERLAQKDRPSA